MQSGPWLLFVTFLKRGSLFLHQSSNRLHATCYKIPHFFPPHLCWRTFPPLCPFSQAPPTPPQQLFPDGDGGISLIFLNPSSRLSTVAAANCPSSFLLFTFVKTPSTKRPKIKRKFCWKSAVASPLSPLPPPFPVTVSLPGGLGVGSGSFHPHSFFPTPTPVRSSNRHCWVEEREGEREECFFFPPVCEKLGFSVGGRNTGKASDIYFLFSPYFCKSGVLYSAVRPISLLGSRTDWRPPVHDFADGSLIFLLFLSLSLPLPNFLGNSISVIFSLHFFCCSRACNLRLFFLRSRFVIAFFLSRTKKKS